MKTPVDTCWCSNCEDVALAALTDLSPLERLVLRKFIVCPICGNKRCPRATNHDLAYTHSNEPGQPGSRYA
jgi:hypothetical protein